MGLFDKIKTAYEQNKEQKEQEKQWVRNHQGTKAICEYLVRAYEKGGPIYWWIKDNKKPACVTVYDNRIVINYKAGLDGHGGFNEYEITTYTFAEMCQWYGLNGNQGYFLSSKIARQELEQCIFNAVSKLPHIKGDTYTGFSVKMFQ